MPDVASQLAIDNTLVRKHGTQILAIADYSTPFPTDLWEKDGTTGFVTPKALPDGFKIMGLISTDGIKYASNVSTSSVSAVQTIQPVRTDIDAQTDTLSVVFLEASAWVQALAHDLPVSQWPADKTAPYEYLGGAASDFPLYRILVLTQDRTGASAFYRIEGAFQAQVTNKGDRSLNRADAEMFDREFTLFEDAEFGATTVTSSTGVGGKAIPASVLGGSGTSGSGSSSSSTQTTSSSTGTTGSTTSGS